MTGLDPDRHLIVEIATLVTDDDLRIVEEGPDIVIGGATPADLDAMSDVVKRMHERSGLLTEIKASTTTLEEAGAATLEFIRRHVKPQTAPLCGNTIGMDRRFLVRHLPEIDAYLHYRSVDVSSVKELCRRWNPGVYSGAPKKGNGHRALHDIRESVAELAYYRENLFRSPDAPHAG